MVPLLDPLESRQLWSAAPVHSHAEPVRHHRADFVEKARHAHHVSSRILAVAATPTVTTGFSVIAQFSNASFVSTAAIADNDIWAVGTTNLDTTSDQPLAVQFDGTSWSAVPTPTLKRRADLEGVDTVASNTAISTNNARAVGFRDNFSGNLAEHWDGKRWRIVSSPAFTGTDNIIYSFSAGSGNGVWAVGNASGGLILHFDSTNWTRTVLPDPRPLDAGRFPPPLRRGVLGTMLGSRCKDDGGSHGVPRRVVRYGTFTSPCDPLHRNSPLTGTIQELVA
jgi:hypothetical protein